MNWFRKLIIRYLFPELIRDLIEIETRLKNLEKIKDNLSFEIWEQIEEKYSQNE